MKHWNIGKLNLQQLHTLSDVVKLGFFLLSSQYIFNFQECGPTICGDEYSDAELMEYLGAKLTKQLGNNL